MSDTLTIVGNVATDPVQSHTAGGIPVTNFRLATTHRRFDDATQAWVDAGTNWYSVAAFRQLGEHAKASLRSGDSVIVSGRLKIRNWEANGKHGTSADIDADAIGHDLRWGTTAYRRTPRTPSVDASARTHDESATVDDTEETGAGAPMPLDTSWATADDGAVEADARRY